jgi:hypothetical protein
VHELSSKNADSWIGEVGAELDQSAKVGSAQRTIRRGMISLQWLSGQRQWRFDEHSSCASLETTASLCFAGTPLPFLSFSVRLLHVGPALMYLSFLPRAGGLVRALLGELVLLHCNRPDSAFVATTLLQAQSRPPPSSSSSASSSSFSSSLLYFFGLPLQRFVSKLLLSLLHLRFVAACLPLYDMGRIKPLSLHNHKQDEQAHAAQQAAEVNGKPPSPTAAAAAAPASPSSSSNNGNNNMYRSTSEFTRRFLARFYSAAGSKKPDDLTW